MQEPTNIQTVVKGKIPPQAIDLEEAVLGALLVDGTAIYDVAEILMKDVFYKDNHNDIYNCIVSLFRRNDQIDLLTVTEELRKNSKLEKIGGSHYLITLTQKIASAAHIEHHARILIQKHIQRRLIKVSSRLIELSYHDDTDVFSMLDHAYDQLNSVTEQALIKSETSFADQLDLSIKKARDIFDGKITPGIEIPIQKLTKTTGGWRGSELIIIAARPSMGKTAFAVKIALHAARIGIYTLVFSLEMSKEKITNRILSMEGRVDGDKFTNTGLTEEDEILLTPIRDELGGLPFNIDDASSLSIEQFQVKAKIAKKKHNIGLIVIDYIQLMSGKGNNREQEISQISRGLKKVAMDLNIPIIALSQLSRAVETRGGSKRPMLSDLRESGAIEQDADMVIFLYRPQYYGIDEWDDDDRAPTKDQCEYIVAKNRNGGLIRNRMRFEGRYTLFSDLDEEKPNDKEWLEKELPRYNGHEVFNNSKELPKEDESDVPF